MSMTGTDQRLHPAERLPDALNLSCSPLSGGPPGLGRAESVLPPSTSRPRRASAALNLSCASAAGLGRRVRSRGVVARRKVQAP